MIDPISTVSTALTAAVLIAKAIQKVLDTRERARHCIKDLNRLEGQLRQLHKATVMAERMLAFLERQSSGVRIYGQEILEAHNSLKYSVERLKVVFEDFDEILFGLTEGGPLPRRDGFFKRMARNWKIDSKKETLGLLQREISDGYASMNDAKSTLTFWAIQQLNPAERAEMEIDDVNSPAISPTSPQSPRWVTETSPQPPEAAARRSSGDTVLTTISSASTLAYYNLDDSQLDENSADMFAKMTRAVQRRDVVALQILLDGPEAPIHALDVCRRSLVDIALLHGSDDTVADMVRLLESKGVALQNRNKRKDIQNRYDEIQNALRQWEQCR